MGKRDLGIGTVIGGIIGLLFLGISKSLGAQVPYLWSAVLIFPVASAAGLWLAQVLSKKISVLYQAAKFVLVGALNTFVDLGILNLLIFTSGITSGFGFSVFKAVSFTGAVLNSYGWNKYWTFPGRSKESVGKEFLQFIVVSITGFFINVGAATVVVNVIGPQFGTAPALWANLGALVATVVAMTWNFLGYKLVVFR